MAIFNSKAWTRHPWIAAMQCMIDIMESVDSFAAHAVWGADGEAFMPSLPPYWIAVQCMSEHMEVCVIC